VVDSAVDWLVQRWSGSFGEAQQAQKRDIRPGAQRRIAEQKDQVDRRPRQ
jgi:hypothetical protein